MENHVGDGQLHYRVPMVELWIVIRRYIFKRYEYAMSMADEFATRQILYSFCVKLQQSSCRRRKQLARKIERKA